MNSIKIIIFSRMQRRRKGIHRAQQTQRRSIRRNRTRRNRTHRNRNRTHSKRIICNYTKRTKGGNYDKDVTTNTRELVPIKSKGVVVAMPGYVFSAKEYDDHMEYMDRQGSS
jgi:hypothetical protein